MADERTGNAAGLHERSCPREWSGKIIALKMVVTAVGEGEDVRDAYWMAGGLGFTVQDFHFTAGSRKEASSSVLFRLYLKRYKFTIVIDFVLLPAYVSSHS